MSNEQYAPREAEVFSRDDLGDSITERNIKKALQREESAKVGRSMDAFRARKQTKRGR